MNRFSPYLRKVFLASAVLTVALLRAQTAGAQLLTYGPILGRGYTPDQTIVRWGTGNDTDASTIAYRKKGSPTWQLKTSAAAQNHEIILTDLAPGETYEYEVRSLATPDGAAFTTCPLPGRPMDFVFYGDSRSGFGAIAGAHEKLLLQVAQKAPEMIFESGDIVPIGTYDEYLQEFFPVAKNIIKSTPFMAAPGNHDALAGLGNNYALLFPTPRPRGTEWLSYYAFTCGNALFLGLNSNASFDEGQLKFLNDQLQAGRTNPAIEHVFVWFHHAPYSVGPHGDDEQVQNLWVPAFNMPENKVSAVFSGHDHIYARMDDGSGVFYIVSGGAGANLYTDIGPSKAWRELSRSSYNFVSVHVAGQAMSAIAYDDTGTELDRFSLIQNGLPRPSRHGPGMRSGCSVATLVSTPQSASVVGWFLLLASTLLGRRRSLVKKS